MNILIVEDSLVDQNWIRGLLQHAHLGVEISFADSVPAAMARLEQQRFDCFLVDFYLPGLSGGWIVRHLRTRPAYVKTPIFLMSGSAKCQEEIERVGASGFVDKSTLTTETLMAAMRQQCCDLMHCVASGSAASAV